MADDIKALTAKIVAAYLSSSTLAATEIPTLIKSVYSTLAATDNPASAPAERQQPAVSVKRSVTPDYIVCLECGDRQKVLKRHLTTGHGLTADEYRAKWALPRDYPLVAPEYAARDLPWNFHPAESRVSAKITPSGAG
ncbi:MucR family transcriptional regulator [Paramagnetospirillum magneticum]|uniref:Predicted transcriptional regulator n=1 Tax=Paramagnetospirillum magneticum (strain ATCC 700264 / AMB-1) TaxID=342108 RepID=Q2W8U7_PARM1|nr:MucR family transcriptional regulator [Paramagnetospirillum magneticum]BAE49728.1 Predicted transcriptional regulator [Paramagnetospirillum magneticum AMB-1]